MNKTNKQERCHCENESIFYERWRLEKYYKKVIYFCPKCKLLETAVVYPESSSLSGISSRIETDRSVFSSEIDMGGAIGKNPEYCQAIQKAQNIQELINLIKNKDILSKEIDTLHWELLSWNGEFFYIKEDEKEILEALKDILINEVQTYTP